MMTTTPTLAVNDHIVLQPVNKHVVSSMVEAYHEDTEAAHTALPWLEANDDVRRQLRDMIYDIEAQDGTDQLHFWSIHDSEEAAFSGLIGLGDELQSLHADYNLGYWVRKTHRRQGLASSCVNAIFDWLEQRRQPCTVEIVVHPHNEAGLATARSICERWSGERMEEFIGIEFKGRTVPHALHLIDLGRGEAA